MYLKDTAKNIASHKYTVVISNPNAVYFHIKKCNRLHMFLMKNTNSLTEASKNKPDKRLL